MAVNLATLIGNGRLSDDVKGELRNFLLMMRNERNAMETLASEVKSSLDAAQAIAEPAERTARAIVSLESRLQAVEPLAGRLPDVQERTDHLVNSQEQLGADLSEIAQQAHAMRTDLRDLKELMEQVTATREEFHDVLQLSQHVHEMRHQMGSLSESVTGVAAEVGRLREEQDQVLRDAGAVRDQLGSMTAAFDSVQARIESAGARAEKLESMVASVGELSDGIPDVRRELSTLKALGDYVAQKISAVEEQRAAVDHAASQGERLGEIMRRVDKDLQAQHNNMKFLAHLHQEVEDLRGTHGQIRDDVRGAAELHGTLTGQHEEQRRELSEMRAGLQQQMTETVTRFQFERDGLEAMSSQITDLGAAVNALESRLSGLSETRETVGRARAEVDELQARLRELDVQLPKVEQQASLARAVDEELGLVKRTVRELSEKVQGIREPSLRTVDEAERRVTDVDEMLKSVQARAQELEGFSNRAQTTARELEQRHQAIEQILADLDRTAELRVEAAQAVCSLDADVQALTGGLSAASAHLDELRELHGQLERQGTSQKEMREQFTRFEAQMGKWQESEGALERALEEVAQRRATVDALGQEFQRLFGVANETANAVRSLTQDRAQIDRSRSEIDRVMEQIGAVQDEAARLDGRRESLAGADEQVARLEALMIDVKSTLDTLHGQKTFLDQVMETAGSLRFQTTQASALIETLREERDGRLAGHNLPGM